jgi:hypothetical protein
VINMAVPVAPLSGRDLREIAEYSASRAVQRAADAARDASLCWGDLYGEEDDITAALDAVCMELEALKARMEAVR